MRLRSPNVQEIVRGNPSEIPEDFLAVTNEGGDEAKTSEDVNHELSSEIPVIDLSLLVAENKEELHKLDKACGEWGFFLLVNHGIEEQVLRGLKDGAARFFDLPLAEKNRIEMPADLFQGYGQAYALAEGQTMDWSDALFLTVYPDQYRDLKFWPTTPSGFKEAVEAYSSEVKRVGEELLRSLSSTLGMEKDALLTKHQEVVQVLRVNYYPPCHIPGKVMGLSPHSDTVTITILMQEDDVTGLHIRKQGQWVPVEPIPNALVVNVGDMTEIWSNGKYKSVEHRGVTNESKVRISYASFLCPQSDVEVAPFDHLLESPGSVQAYKKITYGDYMTNALKGKLKGKSHIDTAKIANVN